MSYHMFTEEIADGVFERWRDDARAALDWLGAQPWCNGRVGAHGYSLLGNTAYAALEVSREPGCPPSRPSVVALVPAISFSSIQPTVFVWGDGLAAELALRFLWLAEVGLRPGELSWLSYPFAMLGFFGLKDWPFLEGAVSRRPVESADEAMWGRPNRLWRAGQVERTAEDEFWREGRNAQCDLKALAPSECPPVHVVAGWHDIFLRQSLDDYAALRAANPSGTRLTVFAGGHFGVVRRAARDVGRITADWYQEHLQGRGDPKPRKAIRFELIGAEPGRRWLECDRWPPEDSVDELFFLAQAGAPGTGSLSRAPPGSDAALNYTYDPASPTPYAGSGWLNLQKDGPQDQRALERRGDVLVLTSEPLEKPLDVAGEVRITLFVRSTAPLLLLLFLLLLLLLLSLSSLSFSLLLLLLLLSLSLLHRYYYYCYCY